MILDTTAALIAKDGISAVSMERVGREAGVSKALVYAYFRNQTVLLQALLLREHKRLWEQQLVAVTEAKTFEELIALTTRTYLRHVQESGGHLQRLMDEPAIAAAVEARERRDQHRVVDFLARALFQASGVPPKIAALTVELSMAMTGAAGDMVGRGEVSREEIEGLMICLFNGSVSSLKAASGKT